MLHTSFIVIRVDNEFDRTGKQAGKSKERKRQKTAVLKSKSTPE
jgi:hypothetical protein